MPSYALCPMLYALQDKVKGCCCLFYPPPEGVRGGGAAFFKDKQQIF